MEKFKRLEIVKSSKTGCDAVKFQTYKSEKGKKVSELYDIINSCELSFSILKILNYIVMI